MDFYYAHIDTPVGPASLTTDADGALVEFYFLNEDSLKPKVGVPGDACARSVARRRTPDHRLLRP